MRARRTNYLRLGDFALLIIFLPTHSYMLTTPTTTMTSTNTKKALHPLPFTLFDTPSIRQPLLSEDDDADIHSIDPSEKEREGKDKTAYLLGAGFFFGVLLQVSTLGVNSCILRLWETGYLPRTKYDVIVVSLLWSAATGGISLAVMRFLRRTLLSKPCIYRYPHVSVDDETVLMVEEYRFVVAALMGICLSWCVMDIGSGDLRDLYTMLVTLGVALGCCRALVWCYTPAVEPSHRSEVFVV